MCCSITLGKTRGQVWVETVLYTLIGLGLIGVTLAIAMPKITEARERAVVEQSISAMNILNDKVREVLDRGEGNSRIVSEFMVQRGKLVVDGNNEQIIFVIDNMKSVYSEPGTAIYSGPIKILTEEGQGKNKVSLTLDYSGSVDLTYSDRQEVEEFSQASIPYSFKIENRGATTLTEINIIEMTRR